MPPSATEIYRFGPRPTEEGIEFRLWAPGATRVELIVSPGQPDERRAPLAPEGEGFFAAEVRACPYGARYLFSRDGGSRVPDPASRSQPEGVHQASQVVDLRYPWTDESWRGRLPSELVIYELHVGAFTEEGTYGGVESRLDHLADLGVTALELMPLAAFPGRRGWGYDGTFHFAPFAGYGSPHQLQQLIDACHARGLAVILDVVTNHFGPEGNAMWTLAPAFFRPDRPTAWSSGMNWEADQVLRYFEEMAAFWVREYHVDGLRFDAFHAVPREARATHLSRMLHAVQRELAGRRFTALLESVDNQSSLLQGPSPDIHVTQLNFDFQRSVHALLTGERHGEYRDYHPEEDLALCLTSGFAFLGRPSLHHGRVRGESRPPETWDAVVNYLQNHDTSGNRCLGQRLDELADAERLRAATALLLLHPGLPMLFMGQEWGATSRYFFFTDLPADLLPSVRAGRLAGFRELDGDSPPPDAPSCEDPEAMARSVLRWDQRAGEGPRRSLQLFTELLALRERLIPRISRRTAEAQLTRLGPCYALRLAPAEGAAAGWLLIANLGSSPCQLADLVPGLAPGPLVYATRSPDRGEIPGPATLLFEL